MEFLIEARFTSYITLTEEDIDDIMASALEGGITYWADEATVIGGYLGQYASEQISHGGKLRIHVVESFDDEDTEWYELDRNKFLDGFKMWVEEGGDEYDAVDDNGTVDCGCIDGCCADEIVQYALFGELVFG